MSHKEYVAEKNKFSEEEDKLIQQLHRENQARSDEDKMKWNDIAQIISKRIPGSHRSGKQCRERWFNQLDPTIKHDQFTELEIDKIFRLQNEKGNRWADIARELPGRTDNNVKNYFYSALRRALRHINRFIGDMRSTFKIKPFKPIILTKILTINDERHRTKLDIKNQQALKIAEIVKNLLIKLSKVIQDREQITELDEQDKNFRTKIVRLLQDFNKHCKKRKQKKCSQQKNDKKHIEKQDESIIGNEEQESESIYKKKKRQEKKQIEKQSIKVRPPLTRKESLRKEVLKEKQIKYQKPIIRSMSFKEQDGPQNTELRKILANQGVLFKTEFPNIQKIKKQQSINQERGEKKYLRLDSGGSNFDEQLPFLSKLRSSKNESNIFSFNKSGADAGLFQEYNINEELNPMKESSKYANNKMTESFQFRVSDFEK